jgi:hypothetical protein
MKGGSNRVMLVFGKTFCPRNSAFFAASPLADFRIVECVQWQKKHGDDPFPYSYCADL